LGRYGLRTSLTLPGLPLYALPGGKAAGEATGTPEVEGFGDEKDEAQQQRAQGGSGFRGLHPHGAEGGEAERVVELI
jgi:hypothetical protein